jgi:hypothetical protein
MTLGVQQRTQVPEADTPAREDSAMASEAAGGTGSGSDQAVVAGVLSDHPAGMAALEELKAMGAQLSEAGFTGVLILEMDNDGRVDARAGDAIATSSSLGPGNAFDPPMVPFVARYADQNERDSRALQGVLASGRRTAQAGC